MGDVTTQRPHSLSCGRTLPRRDRRPASDQHGHLPQVGVPEGNALVDPEPMAEGVHAVEHKVLPANPRVEDFGHVRPDSLKSLAFALAQLLLGAFVVAPVKLVHDEVLDLFESCLQLLALLHVGLEVTRVIMDHRVNAHLRHAHCCQHHFGLVRNALVDDMLFRRHDLPRLRIDHELPSTRAIHGHIPALVFVCACAGTLIRVVLLLLWSTSKCDSAFLL